MLFHNLTDQDEIPLELASLQLNRNIIEVKSSSKILGDIPDNH